MMTGLSDSHCPIPIVCLDQSIPALDLNLNDFSTVQKVQETKSNNHDGANESESGDLISFTMDL